MFVYRHKKFTQQTNAAINYEKRQTIWTQTHIKKNIHTLTIKENHWRKVEKERDRGSIMKKRHIKEDISCSQNSMASTQSPRMPCPWMHKGCTFGHRKTDIFHSNPLWHPLNVQAVHSPSGHNVILLPQKKQWEQHSLNIDWTVPQKHVWEKWKGR